MTLNLDKPDWRIFFERLSRDLADWETTVYVLNENSGAQILSERLPFSGLILDKKCGRETIELLMGIGTEYQQTHNIIEPTKVAFACRARGPAGTLDIEDACGTTTLVTFLQPRRLLADHSRADTD